MATPSRMRARSQGGRTAETHLITHLEAGGWLCASRRHIGGAGDVLAVRRYREWHDVRLIEVKTTMQGPYERFGPQDRDALSSAAGVAGATAWLVWRPTPKDDWKWLSEDVWPAGRVRD